MLSPSLAKPRLGRPRPESPERESYRHCVRRLGAESLPNTEAPNVLAANVPSFTARSVRGNVLRTTPELTACAAQSRREPWRRRSRRLMSPAVAGKGAVPEDLSWGGTEFTLN
ncbi:hypothetical protein CIRG_06291 [Coccidioides immitis RMSCC 2394]|uniref:Uncharacterized protein n=1 Tax=Coccidioides immitis RMSCC 2394 TaxID=404692 RepID=A0A0J6YG26_COCIT|nr:hypothetical protein CIRG_06291 [Coccidioides immitis RMSCC 2394]